VVKQNPKQCIKYTIDPTNPKNFLAVIEFPADEIHIERRVFDIKTYAQLKGTKADWKHIQPANDFLATLDRDEYSYLVKLFVRSKRDLNQIRDRASAMNAITAIDEKVAKTFGKLNLSERIHQYVSEDKRITMPDLSDVGKRPQDTPEKTFGEEEYHLINAIIVISKILFPIFGEIINKVQHVSDLHNGVKEIVAFGIVNTLMTRDFSEIIQKLHNYVSKMVDQSLSDDPMLTFYGITETSLTYDKLAKMIVKNFVNHDLYQEGGNVMRYIAVTIKRALNAETSGSNKKVTYKARILPELGGDDGRNVSLLENAVSTASEPIEIPIIVKIAVDKFTENYLIKNNIRPSFFEQVVSYYKITSLPPTPINELVVAMFVADPIGSAYCVKYMNMEMMVKIIVIIQIYAMKMGFKEIIPLLSLIPTGTVKIDSDEVDNAILISEGRGDSDINYYINLREETMHLDDFNNFNFTDLMENIFKFIVNNVHTFNVSPKILELSDTGDTISEDGILRYNKNIISELYKFLYHLLKIAQLDRKII